MIDLTGFPVVLSRLAESVLLLEGRTLVLPQHSVQAEAAMSAELVRLTLGGRGPDRPELVRGEGIEPPTRAV